MKIIIGTQYLKKIKLTIKSLLSNICSLFILSLLSAGDYTFFY